MIKIAVHSGHFHSDDIFAIATLLLVYPDAEIVRTREELVIDSADIVVDVGGVYDVRKKKFDHHQPEGAGKRENGIPYASFGLVWNTYGIQLAGSQEAVDIIDEKIVMPVDAIDCGFKITESIIEGVKEYSIGNYFKSFVGHDETMEELDKTFFKVVEIAKGILTNEIKNAKSNVEDWREAKRLYEASDNKQIIVLSEHISWKRALIPTEAVYVVAERTDGKWQVRAVPKKVHGFELKKPLPESWVGLNDAELARVSGVKDAIFCHRGRFLAGAESKEGALALAEKALNT